MPDFINVAEIEEFTNSDSVDGETKKGETKEKVDARPKGPNGRPLDRKGNEMPEVGYVSPNGKWKVIEGYYWRPADRPEMEEDLDTEKFARFLSASQINNFLSCPRKWYFEKIEKIPVPQTFALVRGNIVHRTLENFFKVSPVGWTIQTLERNVEEALKETFNKEWDREEQKILDLCEQEGLYVPGSKDETWAMILNFMKRHIERMIPIYNNSIRKKPRAVEKALSNAWWWSRPKFRERWIVDGARYGMRGSIDVVYKEADGIHLQDYKTSNLFRVEYNEDYIRQLELYALLWTIIPEHNRCPNCKVYTEVKDRHIVCPECHGSVGKIPAYVSISYLRYNIVTVLHVDEHSIQRARDVINHVHENTRSTDVADYYPNEDFIFHSYCPFQKECAKSIKDCGASPHKKYQIEVGDPIEEPDPVIKKEDAVDINTVAKTTRNLL